VDLFRLLENLVRIESPSGMEIDVISFLSEYLKKTGFTISLQKVKKDRYNLYAEILEPRIIFTTHVDTVNPYISYDEDDEFIYGRGSCDAKGSAAVQIKAAEKLLSEGIKNVGLLFVVGEESGSDGAKKANEIKNNCEYFINGEPTENKLITGTKGAVRIRINASGKSAHSAYPELGDSAVLKLLHLFEKWEHTDFPEHEVLGKTTWNIGTINGGVQANVIPDHAEAEIMFRTVVSFEKMKDMFEQSLTEGISMEYTFTSDPVILNIREGFETGAAAFATDVPVLSNWGKPFLIGPGSILDAHTSHEKVRKTDLKKAVDLYTELTHILLNS